MALFHCTIIGNVRVPQSQSRTLKQHHSTVVRQGYNTRVLQQDIATVPKHYCREFPQKHSTILGPSHCTAYYSTRKPQYLNTRVGNCQSTIVLYQDKTKLPQYCIRTMQPYHIIIAGYCHSTTVLQNEFSTLPQYYSTTMPQYGRTQYDIATVPQYYYRTFPHYNNSVVVYCEDTTALYEDNATITQHYITIIATLEQYHSRTTQQ